MLKKIINWFLIVNLLLLTKSYGQIGFQKGYFIDLNNQRIECLIKNYGWKNNPKVFSYKLPGSDASIDVKASDVKEFEIEGSAKYISANILIDRSSNDVSDLSNTRNPEWSKEQLFLKVLIDGKTSLYVYTEGNLTRFFYRGNDSINQLVYKKYLTEERDLKINNTYLQQLWQDVNCEISTPNDLKRVSYNTSDMIKHFVSYNKCMKTEVTNLSNPGRSPFHLKPTLGYNFITLIPKGVITEKKTNQSGIRVGLEAEYVLPFSRGKWSFILEPNYISYTTNLGSTSYTSQFIQIPLGLRYYMFLSPKARVFVNGLIGLKKFELKNDKTISSNPKGVGFGFDLNRVSGELRYTKNWSFLYGSNVSNRDVETISFIAAYRIF